MRRILSSRAGIIPARAGFTGVAADPLLPGGDHPRSRGVYPAGSHCGAWPWGSSPLARGLPQGASGVVLGGRIIPARAGFTRRSSSGRRGRRDHPRSRGVYPSCCHLTGMSMGSSPLARGLPFMLNERAMRWGIIPARAGFTLADRWYPNEPVVYQTPAAFTADPGPAPPGRRSVAVVRGGASPLLDVLDATRPPRVSSPGSDTTPTCAGEWRRRPARSGSRRSGGSAPPRTRG